ncbi:MAG: hypothetical protein GF364_22875 [Candidatus Lokiarchaeota archaeon]|nr:hypothetical protein [Candidatus Lokiarchaeota archaeon]
MDNEIQVIRQTDITPCGHDQMLDIIQQNLTKVKADTSNFNKRQSAFMDNMLTVTQMTPLRRARQCLSEIERSMMALRTSYFKMKKEKVKIKNIKKKIQLLEKNNDGDDDLNIEMAQIKLEEKEANLEHSQGYISGAIRKVTQLIEQYNSILEKAGVEEFTEEAFEKEEEEYHIKTALIQAICAARARGGVIDEGNHIYLQQIGLNGATVQRDLNELFRLEQQLLEQGKAPTNELVMEFLEKAYRGYKGCSERFAQWKGLEGTYRPVALVDQAKKLITKAEEESDGR